MTIDDRRTQNIEKAEAESERGPVRQDTGTAPIADAIEAFYDRGDLAFGIPAHRGATAAVEPELARRFGEDALRADLGMNNGVDNRHQSWAVQTTAMDRFAAAVGAEQTLFSTGGSSQSARVSMMATVRPGETLVLARNGHKSAFAGLVLSGARPVYVDPVFDAVRQLAHSITPDSLRRALDEHPEARAAFLFSPSYYGFSAELAELAEIAHERDLPLLVDEAWGLSASFSSRLPQSALRAGADLAINSVHKSLSGLGQTSVLSVQGERIDQARLQLMFELEQSTSASSLLLASIDLARVQFERDGERLLSDAIDRAIRLREAIDALPGLQLLGEEACGPGAVTFNPLHVIADVWELGLSGFSAADWLAQHRSVHVELADHRRIMVLVTYADGDEAIDRLIDALRDLAEQPADADRGGIFVGPAPAELRTETVMLPRDAFLGATEMVPWREASGRVSAEMICPYPPGIPIVAPGERITDAIVEYLQEVVAMGGMVEGAADETLAEFRVVAKQ